MGRSTQARGREPHGIYEPAMEGLTVAGHDTVSSLGFIVGSSRVALAIVYLHPHLENQ